jgi:carbon monoxide dehydrogenase subunit G
MQPRGEQLPEIRKAAGVLDVRFRVQVEVDGCGTSPSRDIVAKLNELLKKVSERLLLK